MSDDCYQDEIDRLNSEISDLQAQQGDIDGQIKILQGVLDDLDGSRILATIKDVSDSVSKYDVGANWQGQKREDFEKQKKSAAEASNSYWQEGIDVRNKITSKISELNAQKFWLGARIACDKASVESCKFSQSVAAQNSWKEEQSVPSAMDSEV